MAVRRQSQVGGKYGRLRVSGFSCGRFDRVSSHVLPMQLFPPPSLRVVFHRASLAAPPPSEASLPTPPSAGRQGSVSL